MMPIVRALLAFALSLYRSRVSLQMEVLALRHQLTSYQRSIRRPQVRSIDRRVWSWLSRGWSRWREVLVFVQPATVLARQRTRFRDHWARLSRRDPGRPTMRPNTRPPSGPPSNSPKPFPGRPRPSTCCAIAMPCMARAFSSA